MNFDKRCREDIYFRIGLNQIKFQEMIEMERQRRGRFYTSDGEYVPGPDVITKRGRKKKKR